MVKKTSSTGTMARGGGTGGSNSGYYNSGAEAGAMIGGNILGGGATNAGGGMIYATSCREDDTTIFCRLMQFFSFVQGALFVLIAMVVIYLVVTFLRNGGFAKLKSMALNAAAVSPARRSPTRRAPRRRV